MLMCRPVLVHSVYWRLMLFAGRPNSAEFSRTSRPAVGKGSSFLRKVRYLPTERHEVCPGGQPGL